MKRDDIKKYFERYYSNTLLQEQDELFGDEDSADDEAADEEGDTETEEEAPEEEAPEEEVEIEAGDEVRLGKPFEAQIDSILGDFEMDALKSAQINTDEEIAVESKWWNKSLTTILLEQEEPTTEADIDIDIFAADVARFIGNYDTLLDMESIIYNKAKELLITKYGDEVALAFEEILKSRHSIDLSPAVDGKAVSSSEEIQPPLAVGSSGAAADAT